MNHSILDALIALFDLNAGPIRRGVSVVFWSDDHPLAEPTIRYWSNANPKTVYLREGKHGIDVCRRDNHAAIVTWYREQPETAANTWRPSDSAVSQ
jgi:hypothetical protein